MDGEQGLKGGRKVEDGMSEGQGGVRKGLLELLQHSVGCDYLSDLHFNPDGISIQYTWRRIDPDDFSLWEWNDAARYLTARDADFEDTSDAKMFLLNFYGKEDGRGQKR